MVAGIVPVLAHSEEEPPANPIDPPAPASGAQLPGTEDLRQAHAEYVQREGEREAELASPAAQQQREDSRHAYAALNDEEASALLQSTFAKVLEELNSEPARYLTDARLDRPLGEGDAVVTSEGKTALLEGPIPVEAENEEGDLAKVDLSLEKTEEGFVPANPLVEVDIGATASEGVEVGSGGMTVTQAGAESSSVGRPFGDKNVFFGEVEAGSDTDLLVSPVAAGVEMYDMLRSADSPETLRFPIETPEGSSLRTVAGGGVEVVSSEGTPLAMVRKPTALDAQGTPVPVGVEVEGRSVVLHVEHREGDYAYPILLDPTVENLYQDWGWWYSGQHLSGLGAWSWNSSNSSSWMWPNYEDSSWPGWHGLFVYTSSGNLPANGWGQWSYSTPNAGTYLANATINPFYRNNHTNCPQSLYGQPYDYDGMWNETSYNRILFNQANSQGWSTIESWGRAFIIGMGTSSGINIPCWRDIAIGGVGIWLEDWQYPYINSVAGAPSGWIKKDNAQRTLNVSASDAGLGVRTVRLIAPGGKESNWSKASCAGTYENRCPTAESGVITYETNQFPFEGETSMGLVVEDPTKKTWSEQLPLKMDGTPPKVTLNGQLARVTEESGDKEKPQGEGNDKLSLPVYNLKVTAEDGTVAEPRSGVKEVRLYLDGSSTPLNTMTEPCSETCPRTATLEYPVVLAGLSEGTHKLEIEVSDLVGNSASRKERKIEFQYIPATGMKEEYVLQHFVIPDGHNYAEEPEYQGPELAVNVTDGNVVFHERDLKLHSERGSLELERVYNSQLPAEKDAQWGHGWSLAQTPELKPQGSGSTATMVKTGAITNPVNLPESQTQPTFSQKLHAAIAKIAGGYEVAYKTDPEVSFFGSNGQIQETRLEEGETTSGGQGGSAPQAAPIFASAFGSGGTGNGQLAHPADVALDAKGNIWVADENNNRLEEFNQKGEFLKALGSVGTGNGQLTRPKSIAFDAKGNIWVADSGNNRLEEFNEKGEFQKVVGSSGAGNGQFSGPESIAIDPKGDIWVADTYNYRVQELNEKGEFIKVANPSGLGAIEPTGLDVGPHGNIWVADWAHNRVAELSEEGSFVRQFGASGTGNGQFAHPDAVTADSRGNVWVVDQNNKRVQQFNQQGEYLAQFGSAGSGSGQFSFTYPSGIAVDSKGSLWVTDTGNNRIQKWTVPGYAPTFLSSFGSSGTGNSQFAHPGDVALDAEGHLWVVDENNNRIEEFSGSGEYLAKFGSLGSGNGQLQRPASIAISPLGNIWVADAGNCRLEEFNPAGEYLAKTGTCGTGNGQFGAIEGVAIDPKGNIWVADTYNNRLQELNEKGEFIRSVGSGGEGPGQLCEPTGIDTGPGGNVWTTEWCNGRVSEFNENGEFVRKFGVVGSENGHLVDPDGIEVDRNGNVWVGDEGNSRVQEFSSSGEYITQFGSAGTGTGQFKLAYPMGIAADSQGHLWVTDAGNNRVQEFSAPDSIAPSVAPTYEPPAVKYSYSSGSLTEMKLEDEASESEPAMSMSLAGGLTTSVSAGEGGAATLSYEGTKLKSEKDPEGGETKYEYDSAGRLKKVTLPNGNWASVVYDATSRATEVTVHAAGVSKTTHFWYGLEPHETKVWGGGNPEIVYSIGEDGSVFKWAYAEAPPTITSISGSLWGNRNSTTPVEDKDQTLYVHASSPHEIGSIKVIENGSAILAETTCEDKSEPPAHNCDEPPPLEWITNPAAHAPGQLNLEVVATDFLGHSTAESFFVTIPQQPPPEPEAPERPNFEAVKKFREDYGLDREHPLTESQMNTLILELLYEWELGEPTAVTAVDNWGVPMRAPELAEMEWRREYINRAAEIIPEWANEHGAGAYGGFYVDDRAGGIIYVGFTENQHALVEALKGDSRLLSPGQIREYPTPPSHSAAALQSTASAVGAELASAPSLPQLVVSVGVPPEGNIVRVGASEPVQVKGFLESRFGSSAPIVVEAEEAAFFDNASRFDHTGPVLGGSALIGAAAESCTAGFGARASAGVNNRGEKQYKYFVLTAGHCYAMGEGVGRQLEKFVAQGKLLGYVRRSGVSSNVVATDGEGVLLEDENLRSHSVLNNDPLEGQPIQGIESPSVGRHVCWSGVYGGNHCGRVISHNEPFFGGHLKAVYLVKGLTISGDSGGPVWDPVTHKAVGLITGGSKEAGGSCWPTSYQGVAHQGRICSRMVFTPLLPGGGSEGIAPKLGIEVLKQG